MNVNFPYFPQAWPGKNNFTIASVPNLEKPEAAAAAVKNRATFIEQSIFSIFQKTVKSQKFLQQDHLKYLPRTPIFSSYYWLPITDKDLHPLTPKIEVGIENEQTVIFVSEQPKLGLSAETIVTVNEADKLHNGQPIPELASQWRDIIRQNLSDALWGNEFDRRYPWARLAIAAIIIIVTLLLITVLSLLRRIFRSWERKIRVRLQRLEQLAKSKNIRETAVISKENAVEEAATTITEELANSPDTVSQIKSGWLLFWYSKIYHLADKILSFFLLKSKNFSQDLNFSLQSQNLLKQLGNLTQLLLRMLFWLRLVILLVGISLIVVVYPFTRQYSLFFLVQAVLLPVIWMSVFIADTLTGFLIDYYLNRWAREAQLANPNSSRYLLRVSTYSPAIKGASFIIFIILGIYLTVKFLGIDISLLASAGAAALVIGFLSRNLFENMLNGALILWTDRYAVGDMIQVGNLFGLVENMTLYTTQLRGAEGRLITIPNGQISTVENLTMDWARVDFTVEIALDADIKQAMAIIEQVAGQMQEEPEWKDLILEPAMMLGVDRVSHAGTVIQVRIKTQPMQHWSVGREFRLRIKEAFDAAGINLGVPQQEIWYRNK
jgi:small conductance mechanosensitive channel